MEANSVPSIEVDSLNPDLFEDENASEETITTGPDNPVTLDLGTVTVGDIFLVGGSFLGVRSASGTAYLSLGKSSGTASFKKLNNDGGEIAVNLYSLGTGTQTANLCGFIVVSVTGTLVLKLEGGTSGGTWIAAIGDAVLGAVQLKSA